MVSSCLPIMQNCHCVRGAVLRGYTARLRLLGWLGTRRHVSRLYGALKRM